MSYRERSNRPKVALWGVVGAVALGLSTTLLMVTAGILAVAVGTGTYLRRSPTRLRREEHRVA